MDLQIELHLLNLRLRILTIRKPFISKCMFPICKLAFTCKTSCAFFSFTETNDDYTLIVDHAGFQELAPFINEAEVKVSSSNWIPCSLSGDDLPGSMSISKIAKFIILPLADCAISIMAISFYQCDYILFQEKDYETVIKCLSSHMSKIYDESLGQDNELIFTRKDDRHLWSSSRFLDTAALNSSSSSKSIDPSRLAHKQRHITLPLIIPDAIEYCITGFYNQDALMMIVPTLLDIMFYETENYGNHEIFFNFAKKDSDISLVLETRLLKKFPSDTLLNAQNNYWKLIRIGQSSVGLEIFGVCASISHPLEMANIDEYYISSYHTGYCFIPSNKLSIARELFEKRKATILARNPVTNYETTATLDDGGVESEQTVDLSAKYQGGFESAKDAEESSQDSELTSSYPSKQSVESIVTGDHVVIGSHYVGNGLKNHLNDTPRSCKFQKNENGNGNGKGALMRSFLSYEQQQQNGEDVDGDEVSNEEDENDQDSGVDKKITFAQDECNSIAAPLEQQS